MHLLVSPTQAAGADDVAVMPLRVASYAELVGGEDLAARVAERLDLDLPARELAEQITGTVVPGTEFLDVEVLASSPEEAQALAWGVRAQLARLVRELETPPEGTVPLFEVSLVTGPDQATAVARPFVRNGVLGLLVGLILGVGIALMTGARELRRGEGRTGSSSRAPVAPDMDAPGPSDPDHSPAEEAVYGPRHHRSDTQAGRWDD